MGATKRLLEEEAECRSMAFSAMLATGIIKTCDLHNDFYYEAQMIEKSKVFAIVTAHIKKKYGDKINYKCLHEQIDQILLEAAESAEDCPFCEKLWKE